MYGKTIICLASSRKPPSGRCIAGKEYYGINVSKWIRPISARFSHEISEEELSYKNGTRVQLLDIVSIPLLRAIPFQHQTENHILNNDYFWTKTGVADWNLITSCLDKFDPIFWGNSQSTFHGKNDKVEESIAINTGSSLKFILASDLIIRVHIENGYQGTPGRRRVRGLFTINRTPYIMSITDPEIENLYLSYRDGDYHIGEAALCISLVEVWNGFAFRVIASIITKQRCNKINGR